MSDAPLAPIRVAVCPLPGYDPAVPLPEAATSGSAGLDLRACLAVSDRAAGLTIAPGRWLRVPTGLSLALPPGFEIQIRPRSGLAARHGVTVLNAPGTIDADYRGEIGVLLVNHGPDPFRVEHAMRVAQMVAAPVVGLVWARVETLAETRRGSGGFGSTGTGEGRPGDA